jgi:K+-sensing histidine kinase KdpD
MTVNAEFFSRVGHDLRGQLATILNGVQFVLRIEADMGPKSRDILGRAEGAGKRLQRLLDEFDQAVWIYNDNRSELMLGPCQLDALVRDALGRLNQAITSRGVNVELDLPGDLPSFEADSGLCGTAVMYILDLAVARSSQKTVHIKAAVADGRTVLSIADEGGAVSAEVLQQIWEPFKERELVPATAQRQRERLGLGLAIARGILTAQGGAVSAENAPDGEGLVYRCTFGAANAPR